MVLTQCSVVGRYTVLEEQGQSTLRMWFGYTFRPPLFAGVISKSEAKRQKLTNDCRISQKYNFIVCWCFCNIEFCIFTL